MAQEVPQHASRGGRRLQGILGGNPIQMKAQPSTEETCEGVRWSIAHQPLQRATTVKQSQESKNKVDAGQSEGRKNQLRSRGTFLSLADISDSDAFLSATTIPWSLQFMQVLLDKPNSHTGLGMLENKVPTPSKFSKHCLTYLLAVCRGKQGCYIQTHIREWRYTENHKTCSETRK